MSLQGLDTPNLPGASQQLKQFVARVRLFMRDYPELNRLVDGEESSDRMIAFAIMDAISDFNSTPPHIGYYTFEDFVNRNWLHPLMLKTVVCLLESVAILQTRNHLQFNDGGISVSVSDKAPMLQQWAQLFNSRWENFKRSVKIADNINSLLNNPPSGVNSELFAVNGFWYDWDLSSEGIDV